MRRLLMGFIAAIILSPSYALAISEPVFVRFHPIDSRLLLTTDKDGSAALKNSASGYELWRYSGPNVLTSARFSNRGDYLAMGYKSGDLHFVNARTGKFIRKFATGGIAITALGFSTDDRMLLGTESGTSIIQWDVENGAILRRLSVSVGGTNRIGMSEDGEFIYCSGLMALEIFRVDNGQHVGRYQDPGLAGEISSNADGFLNSLLLEVTYSRDMRFAALGMMNRVVILSLESGAQVARFEVPGSIFTRVQFSPEFKTLFAFNASSGTAFIWNFITNERLGEYKISEWGTQNEDGGFTIKFDQGELPIDFSPDGSLFAFRNANQQANITIVPLGAAQQ